MCRFFFFGIISRIDKTLVGGFVLYCCCHSCAIDASVHVNRNKNIEGEEEDGKREKHVVNNCRAQLVSWWAPKCDKTTNIKASKLTI